MLFKFIVLTMLAMIVSMLVMLLLRQQEPEETAQAAVPEKQELSTDAKRAERKFSEGVLNVLNYENPMERGRGE